MNRYRVWLAVLSFILIMTLFPTHGFAAGAAMVNGSEQNVETPTSLSGGNGDPLLYQDPQPTETFPVEDTTTGEAPLPEIEALPENQLLNNAAGSFRIYLPSAFTEKIYFVSTNGSDSNPGTYEKPWRTIQKAADTLVAGQTVKILPGTYYARFAPRNSGSPGAYITYTADPGTVTLDGSGIPLSTKSKGEGLVQILGKSYIRVQNLNVRNSTAHCVNISMDDYGVRPRRVEVTGLNIQNCKSTGILARSVDQLVLKDNAINHTDYSSGIGVWWGDQVTVDNNTINNAHYYYQCQGAHEEALTIASTTNFEVKNNTLDFTEQPPSAPDSCNKNDKLGITVKESSQNGLVHSNTVRRMNAAAIYVDGWHAGSNGTASLNHINIFQNKVIESGGIIVGCEQSDGIVEYINIYNNLVINSIFSGIQVREAYGNGLRKNITIYNNTIYGALQSGGNGGAGIYVTTANLSSNNSNAPVIIRNNISMFYFLSTGGGTVGQIRAGSATAASKISADHNIVYGPQKCSFDYPGCVEVGSRITASPGSVFVNPGGYDLRLKDGSPAIDAGLSVSLVSNDFQGDRRPEGTSYDIGAYEGQ